MKRHKLLLGLAFVLFLSAFVLVTRRKQPAVPDPVYNGKHASEWARDFVLHGQSEAEKALAHLGADATPFLLPYLDKPDSFLNSTLCNLWEKLPTNIKAKFTQPVPAQSIRTMALDAFRYNRSVSRAAIPELIEHLKSRNGQVRFGCVDALASLGPEAKQAVPALRLWLKEGPAERVDAAIALWRIEHNAEMVLPIFVEAFQSKEYGLLPYRIARFLPQMGSAAESMLPLLAEKLNDERHYSHTSPNIMLHAMAGISTNSIPYLTTALKNKDSDVRVNAAVALGEIGPPAAAVTGSLEALLEDRALGKIDPLDTQRRSQTVGNAAREALTKILGKATNDSSAK